MHNLIWECVMGKVKEYNKIFRKLFIGTPKLQNKV